MISRNKEFFLEKYKELDYTFNTYMDTTYEKLVNFSQIRNKPIHRWFYFQEGYSPELVVKLIINCFNPQNPDKIHFRF